MALYTALGTWIARCYGAPAAAYTPPRGLVLQLALPPGTAVDRVVAMEDQRTGEQVLAYRVEVQAGGGAWLPAGTGSAIGHKRIHAFPAAANATAVRLTVTETRTGDAGVRWRTFAAIDGAASGC